MAGVPNNDSSDLIASVNATPLVDIALVLLIAFMLTATLIATPSIEVNLPTATAGKEAELSLLGISITASGGLYLNEAPTSERALHDYVRDLVADKPDTQAMIAADKEVSYGEVVRVIDILKRAGLSRFALNIEAVAELELREDS